MTLAALVAYDGTRYNGFQRQTMEKGPTVQGTIEGALARLAGEPVVVEAAGRTDSGVHATGQVVSFQPATWREPLVWRRALNALLPSDIAVRQVCVVPDGFRARASALARSYRYRVRCAPVRDPLGERYAWQVSWRPDVAAMSAAAALLLGEHDFGAFGASPRDARGGIRGHTRRVMREAACRWHAASPVDEPEGWGEVELCFTANAFLTGMVRRLVGTLALVGVGRLAVGQFGAILRARDRAHPGGVAPARGLCLVGVEYPAGLVAWQP